ncbi:MAG: hypothetical protein M0T82_17165 [Desulfobacteraceae bacterium]|nr:hypothetical protein [Desulfobacteraceae bacterium]
MAPVGATIKIIDQWEQWIAEQWNSDVYEDALRNVDSTIQPIVDRLTLPTGCGQIEMEPEKASQTLRECIGAITDELIRWAQGYPSIRWLWMLRRVPDHVFSGRLASTAGYDSTLAEVISGASNCNRQDILLKDYEAVYFRVDKLVLRRLARFCVAVRYLSDRHSDYRWAGKGASIIFHRNTPPTIKVSEEIKACVRIYDQRVASALNRLNRVGTVTVSGDPMSGLNSILWVHQIKLVDMPVPRPTNPMPGVPDCEEIIVPCRFLSEPLPLEGLNNLLSDDRIDPQSVIKREVATLILLMFCLYILVSKHSAGFKSLMSRGYLLWANRSTALKTIDVVLADPIEGIRPFIQIAGLTTTDELLDSLESMTGKAWPLVGGPVVRQVEDGVCFDFAAATKRLEALFEFPAVQGTVANARSLHFEKSVQSIIDKSAWKPGAELEAVRGKTLILNGAKLTDIDAIGHKDSALLIVSCKATIYSGLYDIGEYKIIRNISTLVRDARTHWDGIEAALMKSPVGDNYDFSKFTQIISVVCTPNVAYTDETTMMAVAAEGLPGVASAPELSQWLDIPVGLIDLVHKEKKRGQVYR